MCIRDRHHSAFPFRIRICPVSAVIKHPAAKGRKEARRGLPGGPKTDEAHPAVRQLPDTFHHCPLLHCNLFSLPDLSLIHICGGGASISKGLNKNAPASPFLHQDLFFDLLLEAFHMGDYSNQTFSLRQFLKNPQEMCIRDSI